MKTHALCSADTLSTVSNRIRMHDSSVCLLFLFLKFVSDRRKAKEFNYYIFEVKKYRNMKQESLKEVLLSKVLVFMPCRYKSQLGLEPILQLKLCMDTVDCFASGKAGTA